MADDFNDEDFWDGEDEEGYFEKDRFPRVWLLSMGVLSVILVIGVVALAFLALFRPIPPPTPALSPDEGPVLSPTEGPVLSPTEGPALSPTEGPALLSPTLVPLQEGETGSENTPTPMMVQGTPVPSLSTPGSASAVPTEIGIGVYVKVSGTGGSDLSFRANAGTNYARLKVVTEGSILKVLDGPTEADGYIWWQLQDVSDGMVGWAVADYLEPTIP